MNFIFSWQKQCFTNERVVLTLENKIQIFAPPCNILYVFFLSNVTGIIIYFK